MQNIGIPKGMRDFGPDEMAKRKYIFDTIESVFKIYGFVPIQTPSMERLSVLLGKYGDEGDKLLYRIQNSGQKATQNPEKGLRYDLTVPLARFITQHKEELTFPFKRYQIQPVWRADRPQKGRYREFYQCDADITGTNSLIAEMELLHILKTVFDKFNIPIVIKINNRKILSGIAEYIGEQNKLTEITVAIDKLDKKSFDEVKNDLQQAGISQQAIAQLQTILYFVGSDEDKLDMLKACFSNSPIGKQGVEEIKCLLNLLYSSNSNIKEYIKLDISLARGLNYYTGTIFEVKANDIEMGAISGGGRYDNLTTIFGLPNISGVGLSFGADRIYDVLETKQLFPSNIANPIKILLVALDEEELKLIFQWTEHLRSNNIPAEMLFDVQKLNKQLSIANKKNIPFVAIMGENEKVQNVVLLKDMTSGHQQSLSLNQLVDFMKQKLHSHNY